MSQIPYPRISFPLSREMIKTTGQVGVGKCENGTGKISPGRTLLLKYDQSFMISKPQHSPGPSPCRMLISLISSLPCLPLLLFLSLPSSQQAKPKAIPCSLAPKPAHQSNSIQRKFNAIQNPIQIQIKNSTSVSKLRLEIATRCA